MLLQYNKRRIQIINVTKSTLILRQSQLNQWQYFDGWEISQHSFNAFHAVNQHKTVLTEAQNYHSKQGNDFQAIESQNLYTNKSKFIIDFKTDLIKVNSLDPIKLATPLVVSVH